MRSQMLNLMSKFPYAQFLFTTLQPESVLKLKTNDWEQLHRGSPQVLAVESRTSDMKWSLLQAHRWGPQQLRKLEDSLGTMNPHSSQLLPLRTLYKKMDEICKSVNVTPEEQASCQVVTKMLNASVLKLTENLKSLDNLSDTYCSRLGNLLDCYATFLTVPAGEENTKILDLIQKLLIGNPAAMHRGTMHCLVLKIMELAEKWRPEFPAFLMKLLYEAFNVFDSRMNYMWIRDILFHLKEAINNWKPVIKNSKLNDADPRYFSVWALGAKHSLTDVLQKILSTIGSKPEFTVNIDHGKYYTFNSIKRYALFILFDLAQISPCEFCLEQGCAKPPFRKANFTMVLQRLVCDENIRLGYTLTEEGWVDKRVDLVIALATVTNTFTEESDIDAAFGDLQRAVVHLVIEGGVNRGEILDRLKMRIDTKLIHSRVIRKMIQKNWLQGVMNLLENESPVKKSIRELENITFHRCRKDNGEIDIENDLSLLDEPHIDAALLDLPNTVAYMQKLTVEDRVKFIKTLILQIRMGVIPVALVLKMFAANWIQGLKSSFQNDTSCLDMITALENGMLLMVICNN